MKEDSNLINTLKKRVGNCWFKDASLIKDLIIKLYKLKSVKITGNRNYKENIDHF